MDQGTCQCHLINLSQHLLQFEDESANLISFHPNILSKHWNLNHDIIFTTKYTDEYKGLESNHECDPLECHCAYTHKPEYADILLHNIQSEEPSFCDEFLIGGLPTFAMLQSLW
jgi:hypothetical protein